MRVKGSRHPDVGQLISGFVFFFVSRGWTPVLSTILPSWASFITQNCSKSVVGAAGPITAARQVQGLFAFNRWKPSYVIGWIQFVDSKEMWALYLMDVVLMQQLSNMIISFLFFESFMDYCFSILMGRLINAKTPMVNSSYYFQFICWNWGAEGK